METKKTPPPTPKNIQTFLDQAEKYRYRPGQQRQTINGDLEGPKMTGVLTYPFTTFEKLYYEDFSAKVANTITHPFLTTAKPTGTTPHNLLSGSNYDQEVVLSRDHPRWRTETEMSYTAKSYVDSKAAIGSGIRSEQV